MIKAELDQPKLERSLKRFSKQLGETQAQAVIRWSIQVCRELAMETQVWGKTKTRNRQESAILADAYNVILVVDKLEKSRGRGFTATNQGRKYGVESRKVLQDPDQVNQWIELNRTKRYGRTAFLPTTERMVCDLNVFKGAMKMSFVRAGMAKGAWIGAGNEIAKAQKGEGKQTIGKNFLSYAQKHQKWGDAKKPAIGWKPTASVINKLGYSSSAYVLTKSSTRRAIQFGLRKTVKYYQTTLRKIDQKDKP